MRPIDWVAIANDWRNGNLPYLLIELFLLGSLWIAFKLRWCGVKLCLRPSSVGPGGFYRINSMFWNWKSGSHSSCVGQTALSMARRVSLSSLTQYRIFSANSLAPNMTTTQSVYSSREVWKLKAFATIYLRWALVNFMSTKLWITNKAQVCVGGIFVRKISDKNLTCIRVP